MSAAHHENEHKATGKLGVYVICKGVFVCVCMQEQLEHVEVSTALRYLGQYYFKNKLYDEASLCAQRCCDYNEVSIFLSNACIHTHTDYVAWSLWLNEHTSIYTHCPFY